MADNRWALTPSRAPAWTNLALAGNRSDRPEKQARPVGPAA